MSSSPGRRAIYRGKVKGNQAIRHGEGQSFYPECGGDLFHFQGIYSKGVKTNGKFTFKGHSTYDGEFDANQSGEIEGIGTRVWEDGRQYTGNWAHGEMNGEGKWTSADGGEVYEGTFYENKRQGMGVLTKKIRSDTHIYNGPFNAHKYHGRGSYIVSGKVAAICNFEHGIMQGESEITWHKCSSFKGSMEHGIITSHGLYRTISDSYIYEGQYSKGLPNEGYSTAITATLDRSEVPVDTPVDPKAKAPPPKKGGAQPEEEFAAILSPGDFIGNIKVTLNMQQGPEEALASLEKELAEAQAEKKPDADKIKSLEDKMTALKLIVATLKDNENSGTSDAEAIEKIDGDDENIDTGDTMHNDEMTTVKKVNKVEVNVDKRARFKKITWTKEIRRKLSLRLLIVDQETSEIASEGTPFCIVPMTMEEKASSYSRFASAIRCFVSGKDVQMIKPESIVELIKDDQEGTRSVKVCDEWLGISNVHQMSSGATLQVKFANMEAIQRNGVVSMYYLVDFTLDLEETIRTLNAFKEASAELPEFIEMTIMTLDHDSTSKNDVLSLELKFPTSEIAHLLSEPVYETGAEGTEEGQEQPPSDSADQDGDKTDEFILPIAHLDNCLWRMMMTHEPEDVDDAPDSQLPVGTLKITKITCTDSGDDVNGVVLHCGHSVISTTTSLQEPIEFPWNGVNDLIVKIVDKDNETMEKGDIKIHLSNLSLFDNPSVALATDMELEHSTSNGRISIDAEFISANPNFGTLYVNILSCSELVAADSRSNTSLSDPFVLATLGNDQKQTSTQDNELNPIYNEMLIFDWNGKDKLTINVFDRDANKAHDPIGDISSIDLGELDLLSIKESEDEKHNENGNRISSFVDVELKNENPVNPHIKYMHGTISYELSLEKNPLHFWPKEEAERRHREYLKEVEAKKNAQPPKKEMFAWLGGSTLSTNRWHSVALMVTPDNASLHLDGTARLRSSSQSNSNNNNNNMKPTGILPSICDSAETDTDFFVGGEGFDGFVKSIAVFAECDHVDPMKLTSCYETDERVKITEDNSVPEENCDENENVPEEKTDGNEKGDLDGAEIEAMEPILPTSQSFEFDTCAGSGNTTALRLRLPPSINDGVYVLEISDAVEVPCRLSADVFTAAANAREEEAAAAAVPDSEEPNEEDIKKPQQDTTPPSVPKEQVTKSPTEIVSTVSMVHELQSFRELKIKVERNIAV